MPSVTTAKLCQSLGAQHLLEFDPNRRLQVGVNISQRPKSIHGGGLFAGLGTDQSINVRCDEISQQHGMWIDLSIFDPPAASVALRPDRKRRHHKQYTTQVCKRIHDRP
jgi:hypothetical protein